MPAINQPLFAGPGQGYVLFGQTDPFEAVFDLATIDGRNGVTIIGIDFDDQTGVSVGGMGDLNGDGIADVVIGAPDTSVAGTDTDGKETSGIDDAGTTYVVFGSAEEFPASISLADLNGVNGFIVNGFAVDDRSGTSVKIVGDVNGDGIHDLVIGAPGADPNESPDAGQAYVVFGSTEGFPAIIDLAALDGVNGFTINGSEKFGGLGVSVSTAGDLNGDGLTDLVFGGDAATPAADGETGDEGGGGTLVVGRSHVVFGQSEGFAAVVDVTGLDGTNGFVLTGPALGDRSGFSVAMAGDLNGDGIDDLAIGAPAAGGVEDSESDGEVTEGAGRVDVVFGRAEGFEASVDLGALDGTDGFVVNGVAAGDLAGFSVAAAGDINGDLIDDLLIGAPGADPNDAAEAGQVYAVFGSSEGFPASVDLADLDGGNGFALNGIDVDDRSGFAVGGIGDVNGDGRDDLLIGAPGATPNGINEAGQSYVVFGRSEGYPASLELADLDGSNGFVINGVFFNDGSGYSVGGAVDFNGGGVDDFIIGAPQIVPMSGEEEDFSGQPTSSAAGDGTGSKEPSGATPNTTSGTDPNEPNDTLLQAVNSGIAFAAPGSFATTGVIGDSADTYESLDVDLIRSELLAGDRVTIDIDAAAAGSSLDPVLRLFDSAGNEIRVSDDSPAPDEDFGLDSFIDHTADTSGTYYAGVSGYDNFDYDPQIADSGTYGSVGEYAIEIVTFPIIRGTSGNDFLIGTDGNDSINGLAGDDVILARDGDDDADGDAGNDNIVGGDGHDTLKGGAGDDLLVGEDGDDSLSGGPGDDDLSGGSGADLLTGGGGRNRFAMGTGEGIDTVTDFGGVGPTDSPSGAVLDEADVVQFSGSGLIADNMLLTQAGNDLEITFEGVEDFKTVLQDFDLEDLDNLPGGVGNILFDGQQAVEDDFDVVAADATLARVARPGTVTFLNDADNVIRGFSKSEAENANDTIDGQGGNDYLRGRSGDDLLRGGRGSDTLAGGPGDDVLTGGPDDTGKAKSDIGGLNFTSSTFYVDTFLRPPDTMGGVGPDHIVELINGRYSVYDKDTGSKVLTSTLTQFWSDAGIVGPGFTFDPRILYDATEERWFAVSVNNARVGNDFLVAVSNTSNPTQGWVGVAIDSDPTDQRWADYPTLGLDADGVYVAANMFPISGSGVFGLDVAVLVVPKDDLLSATQTTASSIQSTLLAGNSFSETGYSVQPVVDLDGGGLPAILMSSYRYHDGAFRRSDIVGDINSPTLSVAIGVIEVEPHFSPPNADQPGPQQNLETLDRLTSNVVLKDGAIWGTQVVGHDGRAAVRWFQIDEASNTLVQEGLIADPHLDFYYASIAVNDFGDIVIGFSGSGEEQFVSSYAAIGRTVGSVTTFDDPMLLKEGVANYELAFGGRNRWGDYSATVVDPEDPLTFWTFQEYVSAEDRWSTQITEITIGSEVGGDRFVVRAGEGADTITDFDGVGPGDDPSPVAAGKADTIQFSGEGLVPENMILLQNGADTEITFEGVADTKVVLQDFALEDLDNLSGGVGNILFDGETTISDSFDVIDADATPARVERPGTVTFLNEADNSTSGFSVSEASNANDTINGQGGDDTLSGRSGDDDLRGGPGNDVLYGGPGDDAFRGGSGDDMFIGGGGADTFVISPGDGSSSAGSPGTDTIRDFTPGEDAIDLTAFGFDGINEVAALTRQTGDIVTIDLSALNGPDVILLNQNLFNLEPDDFLL